MTCGRCGKGEADGPECDCGLSTDEAYVDCEYCHERATLERLLPGDGYYAYCDGCAPADAIPIGTGPTVEDGDGDPDEPEEPDLGEGEDGDYDDPDERDRDDEDWGWWSDGPRPGDTCEWGGRIDSPKD